MNKVAVYLRVSTAQQSILTQKQPILDYCKKNDFEVFKEYADEGISGTTSSRPKLDKMLQDMRAGKFDTIIVYRLDRLGRSLRHLLDVLSELRNKKVQLISISDGLNTLDESPMSRAFWQLLGVFAELEREIIVERVKAGLARVRREGKQLGRKKGSTDKRKRSTSGYHLRYAGKSREERKLGPRKLQEKALTT